MSMRPFPCLARRAPRRPKTEVIIARALTGEVGIYTRRDPDRIRAADVAFVSINQTDSIPQGFLESAPELIVEIVSPSDRWQDIRSKIEEYFTAGMQTLWIVEPGTRSVLVYTSPTAVAEYSQDQKLNGSGSLEGLEIAVAEMFCDVQPKGL